MKGSRLVFIFLWFLAAALLTGCGGGSAGQGISRTSRSFAVVCPRPKDTLKTLANRYLKDPGKGWVIADFNNIEKLTPGQAVVIPLEPVNLGGLTPQGFQTVPVLAYSAFSETKADKVTVTRTAFEEQMRFLKDNGYTAVSIEEFFDFLDFKDQLPEKSVLITIDDIGQGVYEIAYPILKKYQIPAALFVCTDLVTGRENALDWDRIREMRKFGVSIQHRTKTLRNLGRRKKDETFEEYVRAVERELFVASSKVREETGVTMKYLAYPYGATNEMVAALLEKNNFRGAFTLATGSNPFFTDNYNVSRTMITGDLSLADFEKTLDVFKKEALR
ncbi:MAG: polysaccharide deacetylase family protein [Thermodesulfobacteriota bacterium]|nr:polysaccharide deacetylase family protein [Thermodesulfobacteriota bacterium]